MPLDHFHAPEHLVRDSLFPEQGDQRVQVTQVVGEHGARGYVSRAHYRIEHLVSLVRLRGCLHHGKVPSRLHRRERDVPAVRETEGVHELRDRFPAPVGDRERFLLMVGMGFQEPVQMPVRSPVELEDVLPGVTDYEEPEIRNDGEHPGQYRVVETGQVLRLVDGHDRHLCGEPFAEPLVLVNPPYEEREDILDGDHLQRSLQLGDCLPQL